MRRLTCLLLLIWSVQGHAQPAEGSGEGSGAAPPRAGGAEAKAPPAAPATGGATEVEVTQTAEQPKPPPVESGNDAYKLKITELEGRVNDLKEKIFRSKTRLAILKETVLASSIAGAEARILHRNEMGSSFKLEKVTYSLDGTPIRNLVDQDGDLDGREEMEILNGPIVPGNHTLSVVMVYRGHGYGIFSYLRGYVFNLRSSHTFHAEEGKVTELKVVGYERGGITTDLKDRPNIRFEQNTTDVRRGRAAAGEDG